jgi:HPt (histidine-containing phosphotransfer) domain-containing protein
MYDVPVDLQKKYLEHRRTEAVVCENALHSKDFDTIARTGHNLKGNARTFGFGALEDLGRRLETAARKQVSMEIEMVLEEIRRCLKEFEKLTRWP